MGMPILAPILNFLGLGVTSASNYFTEREVRKAEISKVKHETRLKVIEAKGHVKIAKLEEKTAKRQINAELMKGSMSLDLATIMGMNKSWKDEYLTIVLTAPFIMAFIPFLAPYAITGWETVQTFPYWYPGLIFGLVAGTFGLRAYFHRSRAKPQKGGENEE